MPKLNCPCGCTVELSDQLRQTMTELSCPNCGTVRKLKKVPVSSDVIWLSEDAIIDDPPLRHRTQVAPEIADFLNGKPAEHPLSPSNRPGRVMSWWERMPWPKRAIFVATVLWLPASILVGGFLFYAEWRSYRHEFFGNGTDAYQRGLESLNAAQVLFRSSYLAAFGVLGVTVVYVVLMLPLLGFWFCMKPDATNEK